ncbi:PCRF domain-containing protein, partial [Patescibacteria group bacterium]|nr:PCRF domain-containing protein [Patescibacteria group bacterium]
MDLREIISRIDKLLERVNSAFSILSIDNKKIRIKELEFIVLDQDFWKDTQNAQKLSKELSDLKEEVSFFENIKKELVNLEEIAKDDIVDKDVSMVLEIEKVYLDILHRFEQKEFYILFRDKYDENNAILSIHAGAGGDDAQDFAQMLVRMYKRFCDKKGFKMDLISETKGGEVGIKSST